MRKFVIAAFAAGIVLMAFILPTRSAPESSPDKPAAGLETAKSTPPVPEQTRTPALPTPEPVETNVPPPPEPTPFSFAWISDTQEYTAKDNNVFSTMTQWVADTRQQYNTVLTIQTGDIVYNAYQDYQWQNSIRAFSLLPKGMRILTAAGNHDFLEQWDTNTPYLKNRPDTNFEQKNAFDERGFNYYTTFTEGGVPFLVFSLAYGYEVAAEDWINMICGQYPDHYAALCLHSYMDLGGYTSTGRYLIGSVIRKSPNIRLVVCGHARGTAYLPTEIDDNGDGIPDRTVHQMMVDTQDDPENGAGFLRILRFHPDEDTIEVVTYSPVLDKFGYSSVGGDGFGGTEYLKDAGLRAFLNEGTAADD